MFIFLFQCCVILVNTPETNMATGEKSDTFTLASQKVSILDFSETEGATNISCTVEGTEIELIEQVNYERIVGEIKYEKGEGNVEENNDENFVSIDTLNDEIFVTCKREAENEAVTKNVFTAQKSHEIENEQENITENKICENSISKTNEQIVHQETKKRGRKRGRKPKINEGQGLIIVIVCSVFTCTFYYALLFGN